MSNNKNNQDDEGSSRVIDSFIRRAMDEGKLDPDELDERSNNVFWDRTTIRAALGGLAVLILVNLFFFYNMRLEQVDNTSDWVPERRGFLVEYREGQRQVAGGSSVPSEEPGQVPTRPVMETSSTSQQVDTPEEQTQVEEPQSTSEPVTPAESGQPESVNTSDQAPSSQETVPSSAIDSAVESGGSEAPLSPADQVRALVGLWAQTWSFKMVDDYLDLYSRDFVSQGGAPFEPWAELRRERIEAPEWIHVSVDELKVFVNADSAVAEFVQVYASSDFGADSRKTLVFQPEDDDWKIIRETVHPPQ